MVSEERKKEILCIQVGIWMTVLVITFILLLVFSSPWCLLALFLPAASTNMKDIFYLDPINKNNIEIFIVLCATIVSFFAIAIASSIFCLLGMFIPAILRFRAKRKWKAEVKQWKVLKVCDRSS